jgi:putative nucleotidyltransferase-like protein
MRPSTKAIEFALTQATERFAAELAEPGLEPPAWSDFEWQMARAAAVMHGITPLLSSTLRSTDPDSWRTFVLQQRQQTELRYRRIAATLQTIADRGAAQGLPFVALKGAALHALGVYCAGQRPMSDIDILVRPADAGRAADLLSSVGYASTGDVWKHQIFEPVPTAGAASKAMLAALPLGEHVAYPVKVELHTRIVERLPIVEPDITQLVWPEEARPGLNAYRSTNALLLHLLLHAAGNLANRSMRLMHLHDIALLTARMTPKHWEELLGMSSPEALWWAFPPLEMLDRYQPGLVPRPVLNSLRSQCPWTLRRLCHHATLSQLSFASMSIPAFPALAWCASPRERLRYVRQRLVPSREVIATRALGASDLWAAQKPWSRQSQASRIVTWLFARPPRQAAMYVVEQALQHPAP